MDWKEEYASGVAEIDRQHQELFHMVEKLENLVKEEIFYGVEVESLVGFFRAYTQSHFVYEEMCMRTRLCPIGEKNKKAHDSFLKYFTDFQEEYSRTGGDLQSLKKLHTLLTDWLINHICKIDIHLKNCVYH